jgi:hypothetical protein
MLSIQKTTDYSQFKSFASNRDVSPQKLIDSIKIHNMLESHPILVTKNKVIIDGQHRLAAAIALKLPIYYVVDETLQEDDIPLCQTQRPWNLDHYLHFYCEKYPDYKFVKDCMKEFDLKHHFLVEVALDNNKSAFSIFRKGDFRIKKDKEEFKKKLYIFCAIRDFCQPIQKSKLTKSSSMAVWRLINRHDYDHEQFMHKLEKYRDEWIESFKYMNIRTVYEKLILDVYNRNNKDKKKNLTPEPVKFKLKKFTSSPTYKDISLWDEGQVQAY